MSSTIEERMDVSRLPCNKALAPCPFCGGVGEFWQNNGPTTHKWILCDGCHVSSPHFKITEMVESTAQKWWNRRSN